MQHNRIRLNETYTIEILFNESYCLNILIFHSLSCKWIYRIFYSTKDKYG